MVYPQACILIVDLLLVLRMKSESAGEKTGLARLMSPAFQLSSSKTSCLVFRFKALSPLRVLLGYVNISGGGRYEERLLHRNVEPLSFENFLTLQRDVGGQTGVEGQQFVLVFESRVQPLGGDLVIISKIQLQENKCNCKITKPTIIRKHDLLELRGAHIHPMGE